MQQAVLERTVLEMNAKVAEVHTLVCGNGLVAAVKRQAEDTEELNKKFDEFIINRHDTCPVRQGMVELSRQRKEGFDRRLAVYGLIIGAISGAPAVVMLVVFFLSRGGT